MPGICPRCNREVYFAEERLALGKVWHWFCFSCRNCRKLLDSCTVCTYSGELFCKNCHSRLFPSIVKPPTLPQTIEITPEAIKTLTRSSVSTSTSISLNDLPRDHCSCCLACQRQEFMKCRLRGGGEKEKARRYSCKTGHNCCCLVNGSPDVLNEDSAARFCDRRHSQSKCEFQSAEKLQRSSEVRLQDQSAERIPMQRIYNPNCCQRVERSQPRPSTGENQVTSRNNQPSESEKRVQEPDNAISIISPPREKPLQQPRPSPRPSFRRVSFSEERNIPDRCRAIVPQSNRRFAKCTRSNTFAEREENCELTKYGNGERSLTANTEVRSNTGNADILTIRPFDETNSDELFDDAEDEESQHDYNNKQEYHDGVNSNELTYKQNAKEDLDIVENASNGIRDITNGYRNFQNNKTEIDEEDDRLRGGHGGDNRCTSCCSHQRKHVVSCDCKSTSYCCCNTTEHKDCTNGNSVCETAPCDSDYHQRDSMSASCKDTSCSSCCNNRRGCCAPPQDCRVVCRNVRKTCHTPYKEQGQSGCGNGGPCGGGCRGGCGKPGQNCAPARASSTSPCRPASACTPSRSAPPCCWSCNPGPCKSGGSRISSAGSTSSSCCRPRSPRCSGTVSKRSCINDGCCCRRVPLACECLGGGVDCQRCGRKVYQAEMQIASGVPYHNICFSCFCCRKPLEPLTYQENCGEIYCKQCYVRNFGPQGYGYGAGAGVLQTPL